MTSCCLFRRFLTFALTFALGVALWQAFGPKVRVANDVLSLERGVRVLPRERAGTWAYAPPAADGSRTWLVIRSTPAAVRKADAKCDGFSVRMRVLFGEDGVAVPGNGFSLAPSSYPLIGEAVAAARAIEFAPATKNGRPVPIWANVTYACDAEYVPHASGPGRVTCGLSVDRDSARTWDGRPWRLIHE